MTLSVALLLGAVGLIAGLMIGLIGIGGVIVVPVLTYLGGIPIQVAIAGAMMGYLLTGVVGTLIYARERSIKWDMVFWLSLGAMPAALLGAWSVHITAPFVLESAIGALTVVSGLQALRGQPAGSSERATIANPMLAGIGAVTGYASAITGTGGPLVLIPILLWMNVPVLTAIGLSQAIQLPIAGLATIGNFAYGAPNLMLGVLLGIGLSVGAWAGAHAAHAVPRSLLRTLVAVVLIAVGLLICINVGYSLLS